MKRGNSINESISNQFRFDSLDKPYFSLQFVDTIKRFFKTYFESSVTVTSNINSPSSIITNGYNLAIFFKETLKLDRGNHLLHIHMEEIAGFKIKITIDAEGGLSLTDEAKESLKLIAEHTRFDLDMADGKIVLVQTMTFTDTISLNSTYIESPLFMEFERAFNS